MMLVFGGAYQGKRNYVRETFGVTHIASFEEEGGWPDSSAQALDHLERYVLALMDAGRDPVAEVTARLEDWQDKILIWEDISGGVVPIDARMRAWREANGRCMALIARHAVRVDRVFCGLGMQVKPCV